MKIFISFSSKDSIVLKSFVEMILRLGLEIDPSEIECTGIEASKPITGEDFKIWIKKGLQQADVIILLLSYNYRESEVCLNEMGAAWMTDNAVFPILIPPLDYKEVGFLHIDNQMLKMDSRQDMSKLGNDLQKFRKDKNINIERFNNQLDGFIKLFEYNPLFSNQPIVKKEEVGSANDFNFFKKFLIADINIQTLFLKSQPTIYDCAQVFSDQYSVKAYEFFSNLYKNQSNGFDISKYETYEVDNATYYDLLNSSHNFPGGMTTLAKNNVIKSSIRFYSIRFKRINEEFGTSFSVWCFIHNRWIFFPKPWRILE